MIGVTVGAGSKYEEFARRAMENVKKYTGLDSICIKNNSVVPASAPFLKLDIWDHTDAENVFFFDADIVMLRKWDVSVYKNLPSIIAVADILSEVYFAEHLINCPQLKPGRYFNTGIMILNRTHHEKVFKEAKRLVSESPYKSTFVYEQSYFNQAVYNLDVPVALIPEKYNYIGYDTIRPAPTPDRTVVAHCAGGVQYNKHEWYQKVAHKCQPI